MSQRRLGIDHRIPITSAQMFSSPYSEVPLDREDPRGREPLIHLESVRVAFESYYARTDGKNPPFGRAIEGSRKDVWLRKSVAEKLARVNELLRPFQAELLVLDGHRSIACQQGLWNFYYEKAKHDNPNGRDDEHRAWARQFIVNPEAFDPNDSRTWPVHTSGSAVDLTLRDSVTRQLLDMGANFEVDGDSDCSSGDYFERQLAAGQLDAHDLRLENRRLLHWAMTHEGLLNETARVFWHYDWGNQEYVRAARAFLQNPPQAAWYGYIEAAL
jgi:zinc D-Ala-D-Ala dipeptidase